MCAKEKRKERVLGCVSVRLCQPSKIVRSMRLIFGTSASSKLFDSTGSIKLHLLSIVESDRLPGHSFLSKSPSSHFFTYGYPSNAKPPKLWAFTQQKKWTSTAPKPCGRILAASVVFNYPSRTPYGGKVRSRYLVSASLFL